MRALVAALLLGTWGCAFQPGRFGAADDDDPKNPTGDAGNAGSGSDGGAITVPRTCAFPDIDLRLCIEFEDRTFSPLVTDGSQMRLDAMSKEVTERTRGNRFAATFATTSRVDVPESQALDLTTALTIEMWVYPSWPQPITMLTNAGQYRMQIDGGGRIGCQLPNAQVWSPDDQWAPPLQWTFIACSYAPGGVLTVYVDGDVAARQTFSNAGLTGAGTQGTQIGELYAGGLDDIRIYGRALSNAEICAHAGRTGCSVSPD